METKNDAPLTGKQHLRNLFMIMGSSLFIGLAIVYLLVTRLGPSGLYQLDHVLLSPENIEKLSYAEKNPYSGKTERMVLHEIQYFHPADEGRFWTKTGVGLIQYRNFYKLISGLTSMGPPTEQMERSYVEPGMTSLSIIVKPDVVILQAGDYRIFQEVQFAGDGNHFRVQLHTDDPGKVEWAYFQKDSIRKEADNLLIEVSP
jgi:hypothetical protein